MGDDSTNNVTASCLDTPGWMMESIFNSSEFVGCDDSIEVSCVNADARANCCKCRSECCGECNTWDSLTCGLQNPGWQEPSLPQPPEETIDDDNSPPTRTCFCTRTTYDRFNRPIQSTYGKSCPAEIVPTWPDDCDQCCSYVSAEDEQNFLLMFLLMLLLLGIPLCWYGYKYKNRGRSNDDDGHRAEATAVEVEVDDGPTTTTPISNNDTTYPEKNHDTLKIEEGEVDEGEVCV